VIGVGGKLGGGWLDALSRGELGVENSFGLNLHSRRSLRLEEVLLERKFESLVDGGCFCFVDFFFFDS